MARPERVSDGGPPLLSIEAEASFESAAPGRTSEVESAVRGRPAVERLDAPVGAESASDADERRRRRFFLAARLRRGR